MIVILFHCSCFRVNRRKQYKILLKKEILESCSIIPIVSIFDASFSSRTTSCAASNLKTISRSINTRPDTKECTTQHRRSRSTQSKQPRRRENSATIRNSAIVHSVLLRKSQHRKRLLPVRRRNNLAENFRALTSSLTIRYACNAQPQSCIVRRIRIEAMFVENIQSRCIQQKEKKRKTKKP